MGERQIIDRCQIFPHNINSRRPLNSRRNFTRSVKTGSNPWLSYKLLHATWIQGLHQGTWSSTDHPGAVKPSAWAEALGQMSRTLRNNRIQVLTSVYCNWSGCVGESQYFPGQYTGGIWPPLQQGEVCRERAGATRRSQSCTGVTSQRHTTAVSRWPSILKGPVPDRESKD